MGTKIKTGQIVDIETYVDNKDNIVLSSAAADALSKANTAETNAKAYTDAEVVTLNSSITAGDAATLASAATDATTKANSAEANAKGYVDTKISTELYTRTLIDNKDTAVLNSANSYTDGQTGITLTTANSNAQFWDTQTLQAAKDYTDNITGGAAAGFFKYEDGYTNGVITGLTIATSATLSSTILAGVAYVESIRQSMIDTPYTFGASVDTYVDLTSSGTYIYNPVTLGAPAPAIGIGNIRIAKVVTDATSITSVVDLRFIPSFYESDAEVIAAVQPELDLKESIINVDSKDAATLASANTYTDTELLNYDTTLVIDGKLANYDLSTVVDSKDASTLSSANSYTDTQLTSYDLSTVVDSKDVATLVSANNYTDTELADSKIAVSVKEFGAVGDGIVDDTLAFQNALSQITTSREKLIIPSGLYKITQTLEIPTYCIVEGTSGSYGTILRFFGTGTKVVRTKVKHPTDGTDDPISVGILMASPAAQLKNVIVENYVDTTNTSPDNLGDEWDVGILIQNNEILLENVRTRYYFRDSGIRIDNTNDYGRCDYVKLTNVRAGGRWGLKIKGPDLQIGTTEIDNTTDFRGIGGISDFMAINCHFESMEHHSGKRYITEDGGALWIDGAVDPGTAASNAIHGHRFYGCRGYTWYPYLFKLGKTSRDIFHGCFFERKVGLTIIEADLITERNVATSDVQVYSKPTTDPDGGTNNLKMFGTDIMRCTQNVYRGGGFYVEQQLDENFSQTNSRAEGIHEFPDGIISPSIEAEVDDVTINSIGSGSLLVQNDGITKFSVSDVGTVINYNNIYPNVHDTHALGSAALRYNYMYTTNLSVGAMTSPFTNIYINKPMVPGTDNAYNLGDATAGFKDLYLEGYSQLGSGAPLIKTKKITGTTSATEGTSVTVAHNLTGAKIISFTLKVLQNPNDGVPASFTGVAGYQAEIYHNSTNFIVSNAAANSANILSKPFVIYITYEQ